LSGNRSEGWHPPSKMAAINWSAAQLIKLGSPGILERAAIKLSAGDVIQVSF